jgi:hypothetical protein
MHAPASGPWTIPPGPPGRGGPPTCVMRPSAAAPCSVAPPGRGSRGPPRPGPGVDGPRPLPPRPVGAAFSPLAAPGPLRPLGGLCGRAGPARLTMCGPGLAVPGKRPRWPGGHLGGRSIGRAPRPLEELGSLSPARSLSILGVLGGAATLTGRLRPKRDPTTGGQITGSDRPMELCWLLVSASSGDIASVHWRSIQRLRRGPSYSLLFSGTNRLSTHIV